MTEAEQNQLIIQHLETLVPAVASEYRNGEVEYEDLLAEGGKGLTKAARSFDPTLGVKFTTWATIRIKSEISHFVDAARGQWFPKEEDTAIHYPDGDSIEKIYEWTGWGQRGNASAICETWRHLDDSAPDDLLELFDDIKDKRIKFDAAFISLTGNQRKLVRWVYLNDPPMSIPQAARELGASRFQAGRMLKRALKTMGEVIARMENNSESIGGVRRLSTGDGHALGKTAVRGQDRAVGS